VGGGGVIILHFLKSSQNTEATMAPRTLHPLVSELKIQKVFLSRTENYCITVKNACIIQYI
jgi:hypothetical protein